MGGGNSLTKSTLFNIVVKAAKITDLSDTYWRWNEPVLSGMGGEVNYRLNVKVRGDSTSLTYSYFYVPYYMRGMGTYGTSYDYASNSMETQGAGYSTNSTPNWYVVNSSGSAREYNSNYAYFHIIGGTSVTNQTLIDTLLVYATQCDSNWNPL